MRYQVEMGNAEWHLRRETRKAGACAYEGRSYA